MEQEQIEQLIEQGLGAKPDKYNRQDFRASGITPDETPPLQDFELGDPFPVKIQWSRGSCTGQAYSHHKERIEQKALSARFAMAVTKNFEGDTDEGAYTANQFKMGKDRGTCEEGLYQEPPATMSYREYIDFNKVPKDNFTNASQYRSDSYWRVEPTVQDIRKALFYHGKKNNSSIVLTMKWYREFNNVSGTLPTEFSQYITNHAVDCVAFIDSKQELKVKNSFGKSWGDNGYFYIPYSIVPKIILGGMTSLDIPQKLPVDEQYGKKRNLLLEQKTAFNPWLYIKIKRLPSNREISGIVYGGWSFEEVFRGKVGDQWLYKTKY